MTIYHGRIKRAVGSIKTAIGLGGSSADTLETVFEHEQLPAPHRELRVDGPLSLLMAKTLRPGSYSPLNRF